MSEEPIKQDAVHGTPEGGPADSKSVGGLSAPRRHGDTRKVAAILGAVLFAVLVAAVVMATGTDSKGTDPSAATAAATAAAAAPTNAAPAASSPREIAGALRRDATSACREAQWDKCLADLDQAARLEPDGDKVGPVQRMRQRIATRGAD